MKLEFSRDLYRHIKEESVFGRYVTHQHIEQYLQTKNGNWEQSICGKSEEGRDIYELTVGRGPLRIMMWSQMHGNETTTTKAILDLLNTLHTNSTEVAEILERCTLKIIPMLNPDGAWAYTRVNANEVDLNRDAQDLSQSESRVLREVYDRFSPSYCFNLHDQRSIYSAGNSSNPASLSFLAPAADENRSITPARAKSMEVIAAMYDHLKEFIEHRVGRYDDTFNINCVGDTFQSLGTSTILFEAGHTPGDYSRENSRENIWHALLSGLLYLSTNNRPEYSLDLYQAIPENEKLFFDILIRNAHMINAKYEEGLSMGILYKEVLQNREIRFLPEIDKVGDLAENYGHIEFDCRDPEQLQKLKKDSNLYSLLI